MHSAHMARGTQHLTDRPTRSHEQTLFSNPLSLTHTHSGMHNHHHSCHSLDSCSLSSTSTDPSRAQSRAQCPLRVRTQRFNCFRHKCTHAKFTVRIQQKMSPIQHKISDEAAARGMKWSPICCSWGPGEDSPCVTSMITLPLIQCWANVVTCK